MNAVAGLFQAGKFSEACTVLCELVKADPDNAHAQELLVESALRTGRQAEALTVVEGAASARPDNSSIQEAVAVLLLTQQGLAERGVRAEEHLRRALALRPEAPSALMLLGQALSEQGRLEEGLEPLRRACELDPGSVKGWFNFGILLHRMERHREAVEALRRAAALAPRDPMIQAGLGRALHHADRCTEGLAVLQRAFTQDPNHPFVLTTLGSALITVGRANNGCPLLARALEKDPRSREARAAYVMGLNYISDNGPMMREQARAFGEQIESAIAQIPPSGPTPRATAPRGERRVRIGFLSGDLREHSCARFLAPIFDGLSRAEFEVLGVYSHRAEDAVTARFKVAANGWLAVANLDAARAASAIRDAGIDVLIECSGYTAGNRLDICAARPAGVQMTFLGYPNTTGLSRIDYRIVDQITDPAPDADAYAVERLLRLPKCLWCFRAAEGAPSVAPAPCERTRKVTVGCFNNLSKVTPQVIEAWAEMLRRVPSATLLFKNRRVEEPEILAWLRGRFEALGVKGDRIEAVAWIPNPADHLKVYDRIDFQLDTFPYNGTTTTCESFWQGVPIVAVKGKVHAARVSMSLLHAVGLGELVAPDVAGYIETAVALASDPGRLASLRGEMRDRMEASPLRDEAGYCRGFAEVLRGALA